MRIHSVRLLSGLIAASALTAACGGGDHAAPGEANLPTVTASVAAVQDLQVPGTVEVRGLVEAEKSATVSSRVAAMVTGVRVNTGDRVARGQIVLDIDATTARGQVSQATGALAQARAALALTERNYERFRLLAEKQAASELELDMARMQFDQAKGAVEQAEGAVAAAQSVASESSVRAPFDGLVVRRMVEIGDLAAPGRPLLMIESQHGRRLSLAVPASLIRHGNLAVGDTLKVRLDGRTDLGLISATVVERSPAADPMSHSFEVKADLPEIEAASGSTGRASIATEARRAIVVPREALHRQGGLTFVVVLDDQQRTESRLVTVGNAFDEEHTEVLSGLSGSETVLLGLRALPPGGSPFEAAS